MELYFFYSFTHNHLLNLMPELYVDQLYYPHGTPPTSIFRRDFYPFDRISCLHVFVGCFRLRSVVVDPKYI